MGRVHYFALSERGLQAINNDAFCAEKVGKFHVFAVAGERIGGPAGRLAGDIAIQTLKNAAQRNSRDPAEILENAVTEADHMIGQRSSRDREHAGMGTDLCACLVDESLDCTILDTGNGSVYYVSPGIGIVLPSEIPFADKAAGPIRKRIISHTLGEPYILKGTELRKVNLQHSFIILSSAGLYDFAKREDIRAIVEKNGENVETSCEDLKNLALRAGSERTITMVVLHGHPE